MFGNIVDMILQIKMRLDIKIVVVSMQTNLWAINFFVSNSANLHSDTENAFVMKIMASRI